METGVTYNKKKLHQGGYFTDLLATNEEINESLRPLLRLNRGMLIGLEKGRRRGLLRSLEPRPAAGGAGEAADDNSRDWPGDGAELGAGGGRGEAVLIGETGD